MVKRSRLFSTAPIIEGKLDEISSTWEDLRRKAEERKRCLDDSYLLHRFLADYRGLISWINDMKAIISADELAKDVAGAEALLERHQEHRVSDHHRFVEQKIGSFNGLK